MEGLIRTRPGRLDLGISLMIHATILLLFFAVSSRTSVNPQEMLTVVLDGQFAMGSEGGGGARQAPEGNIERTGKVNKARMVKSPARISAPPDKTLRDAKVEKKMENPGSVSNSFSEVASGDIQTAHGNAGAQGGPGEGPASGASGTGGPGTGYGAGTGGTDASGGAAYLKKHFAFIRDLILKNLNYPSVARKMGWSGHLTVSFVICEGGRVENIRIVKSSGHRVLDENALSTIREIQPFPRPPAKAEIVIPIEYRLERNAYRTKG